MNIAILSFDSHTSACARYRILTPLDTQNETVQWAVHSKDDNHSIDGEALQQADIIIVQRFFPLEFSEPILEACFNSGKPVIYDIDDQLPDVPKDNPQYPLARRAMATLQKIGSRFSAITVTTPELAKSYVSLNPHVVVAPNRLDPALWHAPAPADYSGPTRLLYAGTETHIQDLFSIEKMILQILDIYGDNIGLTLFGCSTPRLIKHAKVKFIEPVNNYAEYAAAMQKMQFDIALAPLLDTPFNRAKSHVKWLEYSACGLAGIYSDLPPYNYVKHDVTGMLANTPEEWRTCLDTLIRQPKKRTEIARKAWLEVSANHISRKNNTLLRLCYELVDR